MTGSNTTQNGRAEDVRRPIKDTTNGGVHG